MKHIFLILLVFVSPVLAQKQDHQTEAEGPGSCPYCDSHTSRIDDRDIETNPDALTLLQLVQWADDESEPQSARKKSSEGVR